MLEMIVDIFAGGGGASLGIRQALGVEVDLAINHDEEAMAMHWLNHPHTRHGCADVWSVDPRQATQGRPVGLAWFSPDCMHFSRAKGGKPVQKKIRSLAWVVIRWARAVRPRIIIVENVPEFREWGPLTPDNRPDKSKAGATYHLWYNRLRGLDYEVQSRELRACDYGAPTIRKRLFIIARCDRKPIAWPEPTHGPGRRPYHTAAECIDWSLPCPSIFMTPAEAAHWGVRRPLAEKTMERIARGIRKFVLETGNAFIIKFRLGATGQAIDEPMHTITAGSFVKRPAPSPADAPLPTVTGQGNHIAEVRAFLMRYNGVGIGQDCRQPLQTCMSKDRFGIVIVEGQEYQIADIGLRMLTPRELARAQGFPDEYHLTGSKSNQVAKIGNSVCPPIAAALVAANVRLRAVRPAMEGVA